MVRSLRPARPVAAFIFDLDGTLIDSGLDIALSANRTRQRFGLAPLPLPQVLEFVGDGAPVLIRRLLAHADGGGAAAPEVTDAMVAEGVALFREHYGEHCLDNTRLYPGVPETLAHFADVPLAVATNKPSAFARPILDRLGIGGAFRRIVAADDVTRRKPDPEHLRRCLEGLDLAPGRVVVVGDSRNDILAARALGAVAVGATYGLSAPEAVRAAAPDLLIDGFAQLRDLFSARVEGRS